jgi:hypothetical protein
MKDNPYQPPTPLEATVVDEPRAGFSVAETARLAARFRGLLFLYLALVIGTIVASFALESYLPEELRLYEEAQANAPPTAAMLVVFLFALVALVLHVVGWLGMLFFWRPSRWIFLASEVLFFAVSTVFGASVYHGVTDAIDTASAMVAGAILAMAFFSPVRERFAARRTFR